MTMTSDYETGLKAREVASILGVDITKIRTGVDTNAFNSRLQTAVASAVTAFATALNASGMGDYELALKARAVAPVLGVTPAQIDKLQADAKTALASWDVQFTTQLSVALTAFTASL